MLRINRRYTGGVLKEGGKTDGSVRAIPLRQVVLDALDAMPPRIDTRVLLPAHRGGYVDIERFRHRAWAPALRAALRTAFDAYDTASFGHRMGTDAAQNGYADERT